MQRYLIVSKPLHWDPKNKRYFLVKRDGVTARGAVPQTLLKEAIWDAKQRRKKERKEARLALRK